MQPLKHFDGTRDARRPMVRVDNVREAAKDFRRDMLAKPKVRFYKSFELVRVPYPAKFAYLNAFSLPTPFVHLCNRLSVIQFDSSEGIKTLLVGPSDWEHQRETPFFAQLDQQAGKFAGLMEKMIVRATATVQPQVEAGATLSQMVNAHNKGRCAITLDPLDRQPGQQPYQGVVPLFGDQHEKLEKISEVLEHYMLQSEQLDTKLVLAANGDVAAGLLIQRLPVKGQGNLEGTTDLQANEDEIGLNEHYNRIAILASTLKAEELLTLDADTILRRLFWEESITRFEPATPSFACSCSRERVGNMLRGLGVAEVESILAERADVEVGCEFCGEQYSFDPVDAAQLFTEQGRQLPPTSTLQ